MVTKGRERYLRNLHLAREQNQESRTAYARRLIQLTTETYSEAIKEWITQAKRNKVGAKHACLEYIEKVDPLTTAVITLSTVIDLSAKQASYPHTIMRIAKALFDEYRFTHFKKTAPVLWKKLQEQMKRCRDNRHRTIVLTYTMRKSTIKNPNLEVDIWPTRMRAHLGTVLLELLKDTTGIVETQTVHKVGSKQNKTLVTLTEETMKWAEEFHQLVENKFPIWMPMINEPEDWTTPFLGGYDREYIEGGTLIKARGQDYVKQVLENTDISKVYESINLLQKTPWKINKEVLQVIEQIKDYGNFDLDIPSFEDKPLPAKPADIETNKAALKKWKAQVTQTHLENVSSRAKRLRIFRCVDLASKFSEYPAIYFPYQLDFRGRAYCSHSYLSPQGDDLSKALLIFANGKPVFNESDVRWLAIHGANTFGVDKVSFDDRVSWVHENESKIMKVVEDPIQNTMWHEADKPWQFLAWCFEWYKYIQKGYGFITHLPVQIDGSNNGLQILSILARDEEGAKETNCIDHQAPVDIYGAVAKSVVEELKKATEAEAAYWLDFGIDRKTVKRSVMIVPYGGTFFSSEEYIKDWYTEQARKRKIVTTDLKLLSSRLRYLSKIVWTAVCDHTKCAQTIMAWMMKCASILCKEDKKITWITPLNFPVRQDYVNQKKVNIQTALGEKFKWTRISIDDPTIVDKRRNINAISPNFVHSLDASILHETVRMSSKMGITDLNVVHDSFGTHCTNVEELSASLRFSAYQLFQPDLLSKLHEDLQRLTDTQLPRPPELGLYDVSNILNATYMFA